MARGGGGGDPRGVPPPPSAVSHSHMAVEMPHAYIMLHAYIGCGCAFPLHWHHDVGKT